MTSLTYDEKTILCLYNEEHPSNLIDDLTMAIPLLRDEEMEDIVLSLIRKVGDMDCTEYRKVLAEADADPFGAWTPDRDAEKGEYA